MSGIVIPDDRSTKQRPRGFCNNPSCAEQSNQRFEFDVEHSGFACPKCGANGPPIAGLIALIHMLVADRNGRVWGQGMRFRLACDANRAYLATPTNQEAATGDARYVNCPGCLLELERTKAQRLQGMALIAQGANS